MLIALKNQRGAISAAALLLMLALLAIATVYAKHAVEGFGASVGGYRYPDEMAAQQAAVSGIYYVLAHAKQNTGSTRDWDVSGLARNQSIAVGDSSFSVDIEEITSLPSDITGSYYRVTATGICNQSRRVVQAYLNVPPSQSVMDTFELIKTGRYSGKPWDVNEETQIAKSPASAEYNQVLFNDQLYGNDSAHLDQNGQKGFTLNYMVNLRSIVDGHENDNGYGVIYLASGDPNNYSGYVLQYDPGLSPDQILVKKVVAGTYSTTQPWANEIKYGTQGSRFNNQSWQYTASPQWSENSTSLNTDLSSYTGNVMIAKMETVLDRLNKLMINGRNDNKMLGQDHTLTIDVRPDSQGNLVHSIRIDGLEILKFIDRDKNHPIFTQGGSGLRVWEADVDFYNNINPGGTTGQLKPIQIVSWTYPKS